MKPFAPKFTITNPMTSAITQLERARGFLEAARLSDDWVRDMGNPALIKEAHHTTHIENPANNRTGRTLVEWRIVSRG
jgi:hypothetical protein